MGLDMYLHAERYVGAWSFQAADDPERTAYSAILKAAGMERFTTPDSPGLTVRSTVAYWRKANAIHGWFVNTLAEGRDECQDIYVEPQQLESLADACRAALACLADGERAEAVALLPPTPGFFFGSTDDDEWYASNLRDTIIQLERVLADLADPATPTVDLYYRASW